MPLPGSKFFVYGVGQHRDVAPAVSSPAPTLVSEAEALSAAYVNFENIEFTLIDDSRGKQLVRLLARLWHELFDFC